VTDTPKQSGPAKARNNGAEATATVIKKYANRRLYNTGTSTYVTLEDLADMVKAGDDFVVRDAKTSEDITRSVLTQIIFEQEAKGQNLLPVSFLRQLIRFYGDSMQAFVPGYLSHSLEALSQDQSRFRQELTKTFGTNAFELMDEQVKRNTAMFEQAMRVFSPFPSKDRDASAGQGAGTDEKSAEASDLETMKDKLAAMEARLEQLSKRSGDE